MKKLLVATAIFLFAGLVYGQTLEKGGVLAFHRYEITLAPGVTMDQYLDFMTNKLMPEMLKAFQSTQPYKILKGIGVNNQHEYAFAFYWESLEVFRSYWNEDGTPTEKGAEAMGKLQPLIEEMNALATSTQVPGDWLILD